MGPVSRDTSSSRGVGETPELLDNRLLTRAWRTGAPFTLLHDEGFVVEKYQELLMVSHEQTRLNQNINKTHGEAQTTVSGMNEASMDEMQHATDMARIKLFAPTKRGKGGLNQAQGHPSSPSSSKTVTSTLTSSSCKENPPSAMAGIVGNTLSRESPESVDSEKMRTQRNDLLQIYFSQIAAKLKHSKTDAAMEIARNEASMDDVAGGLAAVESGVPSEILPVARRHKISRNVTAAGVFSVCSLRMQLEILREFSASSPRLFENGTMALVQTLLDSPPFELHGVVANSPEDALLNDVYRFCTDMLHSERGGQEISATQRQIMLLLLLGLGVSSGRVSLLLEFVNELLATPRQTATNASLIQGESFATWMKAFMLRMQTYRIDFTLGTFEDDAFAKSFAVKNLLDEAGSTNSNDELEVLSTSWSSNALATDGHFAYAWSLTKGLSKIGTGLNFTIAGKVYAEVPASAYLNVLEEKRTTQKLVYGFGEHIDDVSEVASIEMARTHRISSLETQEMQRKRVGEIFGRADGSGASTLLISYCVGDIQDICALEDDDIFALPVSSVENEAANFRVCRAWYGDLDVLSTEAVHKVCDLLLHERSNTDEVGILFTHDLIEELLILSGISLEKMADFKRMMVIFTCGSNPKSMGAQILDEGDRFFDVERRTYDSYHSSLVWCDDSLYLNVMYPDIDASGKLCNQTTQRCRQLLRISPQNLGFLEALPLWDKDASIATENCTVPLYTYVTEGRLIYEIEMGSDDISVSTIVPKAAPGEGKTLVITRKMVLNKKKISCCDILPYLAKIRSAIASKDRHLDVQIPSFYTNGASLGMLIADRSTQEIISSQNTHCVLFDCENGQTKDLRESGGGTVFLEEFSNSVSVCFDAKNNLLWLYNEHKRVFQLYRNSGKRIPMDDNSIPSSVMLRNPAVQNDGSDDLNFQETSALSILSFLYKNAVASDSSDVVNGNEKDTMTVVPFAVDLEAKTFKLLLKFISKYVDVFKANDAPIVQLYILQACLGILNKNLETLLLRAGDHGKQEVIALLMAGLSAPLDSLLELLSQQNGQKLLDVKDKKPAGVSTLLQISEQSRMQVASAALDLYTTSIRVFHSDVSKQFTQALKYLRLWKQSKATDMELKILARLLAHLCTRVDGIYQTLLVTNDALGQFLELVEFAVEMQQRQLRQSLAQKAVTTPMFHELSELISLVNAITQTSFVALGYASENPSRKSFDIAIVVFETIRDSCSSICGDLVSQMKHPDNRAQWPEIENVLKNGFFGILAPVVLSSGIMLLRNRGIMDAVLSIDGGNVSLNNDPDLHQSDHVDESSATSRLFTVMKDSSSKLLEFVVGLDALVSMVDPSKRERTVENASMALKSETMESSHEYDNNLDVLTELKIPGAVRMVITFDPRSRTEVNYDYLTFYKDKSQGEYYGNQFYSGRDLEQNWPGVEANEPLIIESDHCFVYFHTDGSNTDWGYKFTATAEVLERKKSLQLHWIMFLLESAVQFLDEVMKLLVEGSICAPINDAEIQNEQYLQSCLLKSGVCAEDSQNIEVLRLLQDFVEPPESSDAEKVIQALHERSGISQSILSPARSLSFDHTASSVPNKSVNRAVRAVAAAIFHHNMWGMDAYAFAHNLRDDISEQLLRGWKNAQKMRDWFHLGDAADAGVHGQVVPNRRRSGRLRRQPSAYKGLSEESLVILCDNVIERARFLLEMTPMSFAYVTGAKRRWGLLAKYGYAIGNQNSTDNQLDKWYNLLDELQATTELRNLFQYRRLSSERLKHDLVKSATEQVLEFIQSDVDVSEVRKVIQVRNRRAAIRALGMEVFVQTLKNCQNLRLRAVLLESFISTLKCFVLTNSPTNVSGSGPEGPTATHDSFPRLHFDALLSGCDETLRQQITGAFGNCLAIFAEQLASIAEHGTSSGLVTGVLRCCAIDYDLEDSCLLQESRILPQILRLLSSDSVLIRNAAQSLLGVLLSRFVAGQVKSDLQKDDSSDDEQATNDRHNASAFQRQLFSAVGHQLTDIVDAVDSSLHSGHDRRLGKMSPQYLPANSPGFTAPCLQRNAVSWNHSIMLWIYSPSKGPLYALKLGDEVRRGPTWADANGFEISETEVGIVISIPTPTRVHVRWNSSGRTSQCEFDPKRNIFDVLLVDEGVGGTIFFKGNKTMVKDTAAAKPWSHFGLSLTDKRMLVYKIACGSDKESVFETDYELDADQWSHVAVIQDEDTLRIYVNGSMVSQHLLESFLLMNASVDPTESAIIESAHPLDESIDEYCPVHIPGAVKIRLTFDSLCDIDGSAGFVRFYKDAKCVEYWGDNKYTGKYSDPERNFPGAQSNRARSLQHAEGSNVDLNALEIPSDRFLVYFHNEGCSESWGFRILASPEFDTSGEEFASSAPHLNPYPFYFGEAPGRVLDEPAAKCWIHQPKVLSYPISEDDLTTEIQTSFPSTAIVSSGVPAERTLHILGLVQTCTETSFGRSLIGTPENLRNLIFLSFDGRVPVEIRIGALRVLKNLIGILSPEAMNMKLAEALPSETDSFLLFIFKRLGSALNVWSAYDEDTHAGVTSSDEEEECVLELRTSAQGETSLAAAYVSLLRGAAEYSCWSDQVFKLLRSGLQCIQDHGSIVSKGVVRPVLASLALLGGRYGGAYIGGRVSCCVNVDGKEMVESGFLVQFRMKCGAQIARVIFDCDQTSIVDVPLTDVAYLDDVERAELTSFLTRLLPFASELEILYRGVLDLRTEELHSDGSYQPQRTKKENTEVLESEHPYAAGEDVTYSLNFRGASEMVIQFDKMSCTAGPNDYLQFKKREGDVKEGDGNEDTYWGEEKYYGESFPGVGTTPPLRIPAGNVDVLFRTESLSSGISEWGFKLTAHAFEETVIYPPEIPPSIMVGALNDIHARCIKSLGRVLQYQKHADVVSTFTTLLPTLTRMANAPSRGRPIQSSPKSQMFESKHPYANSVTEYMKVTFNGASILTITFDPQSRTEQGCDYLCFFKDKSLTDRWGAYQYCGVGTDANWPGVEDRPPLVIPAESFILLWTTDGSNVDWGWKLNVTAEFLPEFSLDKSVKQLDARCHRLFEYLYEKLNHQRIPLKSEFEEFTESDSSSEGGQTSDPARFLLLTCRSKSTIRSRECGSATSTRKQHFYVIDKAGLMVYEEKHLGANVLAQLEAGTEFLAEADVDGWLKVTSSNVGQLDGIQCGWVWQRTGDTVHARLSASRANGEDLLTLGVDNPNFENRHSVLAMDEGNDQETSLTLLCSPFAFDDFKGQTDRIQSLAYDTHRAITTKTAREAILTLLSCDPKMASIPLSAFGDVDDILLLLSHLFVGEVSLAAYDSHSSVLLALRKRIERMVLSGADDTSITAVLIRCREILEYGPQLLPKGRGSVRILESTHPYQDNADQYWDISIPGATRIKVVFDRRCKTEAGCDWVRLYKSGSNRTETIGPDQIGGRGDSENWPGTGNHPALYIEDDAFEVYFHSDSSNNDWGFKLYATGIFVEEDSIPFADSKNSCDPDSVVQLLLMASWVLEALSSISDTNFEASPTAFSTLYSAETLQALISSLNDSPQCIKTCTLQLLGTMSQSAGFHTIPTVFIEQVRDLINVKMRAKYQVEDRVELKSPYLQALVQCAIAVDLSIDSHCYEKETLSNMVVPCSLPCQFGKDGVSTFTSPSSSPASGCYQFQLSFDRLVSAVTIGLMDSALEMPVSAPVLSLQWMSNGALHVRTRASMSDGHDLAEVIGYRSRIWEGDIVIIQVDLQRQTLAFRKNSVLATLVAGPTGSGALIPWDALQPSIHQRSDIRLVVSHSSAENRIEFSSLCCSPVALIPQAIVPNWYSKVVDAVSMMLDFRDNLSSTVISRESRHPLTPSSPLKPIREHIDINGAVMLEIRFDTRTKLNKLDEFRFFSKSGPGTSSKRNCGPSIVLSGINGELDASDAPHLFADEGVKQHNYVLAVGDVVVRSLDWEYGDEDGGAGSSGIVQEITAWGSHAGKGLRVRWQETGFENVYRYGHNGRYDVQNVANTKYHNAPLMIQGSSLSYEFVSSVPQQAARLSLNSTAEFAGSLELDGTIRLDLKLVEEKKESLSNSDCSVEFWTCISEDMLEKMEGDAYMELLRIDGAHTRIMLLSDQEGRCALARQGVENYGTLVECHQHRENVDSDSGVSGNLAVGQWIHLALVFAGLKVYVVKNGDIIYSIQCLEKERLVLGAESALVFGDSCSYVALAKGQYAQLPCLAFRGHLYDIRLWDVAFRVEQLRSHFRGLDSVDVVPKSNSRPGTPTSACRKPLSPSMTYTSSPRSPRSSLRPVAVPQHMRKWITTNRTSKDISTVRLNCSVKVSSSTATDEKPSDTVYYEAHTLSSGNLCVGWILNSVGTLGRSVMIGEEEHSFGIDIGKKVAHFSTSTEDLAPFTRIEPSGHSSPRRFTGNNSFENDVFCRNGDVIGCAMNLANGKLTFYVNGEKVAELVPSFDGEDTGTRESNTEDSALQLDNRKEHELNALVHKSVVVEKLSQDSTTDSVPASRFTGAERRFCPSASLSPQGAQGLAWNFGQRPFKHEPNLEDGDVLSLLQASNCSEDDAFFEVYDYEEQQWHRVLYRHKIQDITPRLIGWWKLNEGIGDTVDDASGNSKQGIIEPNNDIVKGNTIPTSMQDLDEDDIWWNQNCSPPSVARRRAGDGSTVSPFFPFGSSNDSANQPDSLWGYKFYIIPHFSMKTVGRRHFQSALVRFGDSPRNLLPRHDHQLIKYINKKGQSKNLNVTQLLHGQWNDIAPQKNELVRWPVLMEILTFASDERKLETTELTASDSSRGSETPKSSVAHAHNRLSKRFKVLQEFNTAIYRMLPFVAFRSPSVNALDTNTSNNEFGLSYLVMEHRHRILSVVKRTLWNSALGRTNESGMTFELTLNRPKAMRFRVSGKTDVEGRHTLFSQAFRQLQSLDGAHFRREDALYHVTFLGENAQDAGGPYRETFAQYCEELQSTQLPLMLPTPNSQHNVGVGREKWLLSPGARSVTAIQMLEFLGKLMGASIRSKQYLALNLASLIWKKLAGERLGLDDLATVDSVLVSSMSKMRTIDCHGVTEEMFEDIVMENFTTLGADNRVIELKPDGANIPVTFNSRCEYADLVEQARLHESDAQAQAIFRGIAKVVPAKLLACFSGAELELMVCGSPEVDVDLLEECTEYSSCSPTDDHIIWFWRALRDFSHEERSTFLRFAWGRSRLPASADEFPQRFKLQSFSQQRANRNVDAYMPVAHTCFFSIEVPAYSSESVLREKLLYAIYNCQEIDGDGDSVAANQLGWEE